uniref:Synaptotagmin-like protein 2 n=1 Tax=Poecilia formosa TaxID=48698 RepID=A0A096LYZ5_POEFO
MIDLSHLTEEEQEVILTVLKRDEELKRAEEERIRKLEKVLDSGSQSDVKLKYLSGEWFYAAKSQRHSDKIHGSEIILASMKQGKPASLDGSVRVERSKTPSSRSSDAAPPPKPARCFESSQPPEMKAVKTPSPCQRPPVTVVTALARPKEWKLSQISQKLSQKPVPKKRTFLPRRGSQQGLNAAARPAAIVPAPRRSRQLGSSGSSNQSGLKITDETPQENVYVPVTGSAPTSKAADKSSLQPLSAVSQVSSHSSLETDKNAASITRERLPSNKVQDRDTSSSVGTAGRQEEMSLPPNTLANQGRKSHSTEGQVKESKSVTPADRVNSTQGFAAKETDVHFVPGKYGGKGFYDKYTPDQSVESEQQPLNNQKMQMVNSIQSEADEKYNNDSTHLKLISNLQTANRQAPASQLDPDLSSKVGLESESFSLSRNGLYMDENEEQLTTKAKIHRDSVEDVRRRDSEDKNFHSGSSPKRKDDSATKKTRGAAMKSFPSPQSRSKSPHDKQVGSGSKLQSDNKRGIDEDNQNPMSKSVPSFLQNEVKLSPSEERTPHCVQPHKAFLPCGSNPLERLTAGSSATILSSSSGMTSVSSLSGSVMTMYSGDFVEVQGTIQFSINYVQRLREFHIFVAECRDLAAVDPKRNRSDPYVKSYLVPDKANLGKRKTSVKKKTLNPTFNEILRYRVRMEYLRTQTLILSVWHHDTFGKNSFLGEVDVELSKWDFDHTQMNYLALKARTLPSIAPLNGRGEMRLAIRYLPQITHSEGLPKDVSSSGEIHIWVKECKNLPLIRATIDPYVKCFVLPDTSRKSRQKTRVLRRTAEPVFNHTMVYDGISEADLTEACVELTVWDRDRLASNLLGGLRLGAGTGRSYGALVDWMDSGPYEVSLWDRMMASPSEWVEDVLPLRMLSSARTALK